ncbi:hypothetical protein EVAR_45585_1 [Eumeta japonica]|uniref:Uncharacterized protein n=1 Tax=Eumeta variegata TaxID=151549 RepID=A0A4C1YYE2_EUMVA|nr:hypothetical protein EVAR_45585_1 [Eumeta japonica]
MKNEVAELTFKRAGVLHKLDTTTLRITHATWSGRYAIRLFRVDSCQVTLNPSLPTGAGAARGRVHRPHSSFASPIVRRRTRSCRIAYDRRLSGYDPFRRPLVRHREMSRCSE